jgi:hypothetical protein
MAMDTTCLYTTVKNTSGVSKFFGFLPPHGRTLASNEEFTVFGNILQALGASRGSGGGVLRRDQIAFESAIESGKLTIVQTPSPVILDVTTEDSKVLKLDDEVLSTVNPCWMNAV